MRATVGQCQLSSHYTLPGTALRIRTCLLVDQIKGIDQCGAADEQGNGMNQGMAELLRSVNAFKHVD